MGIDFNLVKDLQGFDKFAQDQVNAKNINQTNGLALNDGGKAVGGKAILDVETGFARSVTRNSETDPTIDHVGFIGRSQELKNKNNAARKAFLSAVLAHYGNSWTAVPKGVKSALKLQDFSAAGKSGTLAEINKNAYGDDGVLDIAHVNVNSGKPLTARRINAVIKAMKAAVVEDVRDKPMKEFLGEIGAGLSALLLGKTIQEGSFLALKNKIAVWCDSRFKDAFEFRREESDEGALPILRDKIVGFLDRLVDKGNNGFVTSKPLPEWLALVGKKLDSDDAVKLRAESYIREHGRQHAYNLKNLKGSEKTLSFYTAFTRSRINGSSMVAVRELQDFLGDGKNGLRNVIMESLKKHYGAEGKADIFDQLKQKDLHEFSSYLDQTCVKAKDRAGWEKKDVNKRAIEMQDKIGAYYEYVLDAGEGQVKGLRDALAAASGAIENYLQDVESPEKKSKTEVLRGFRTNIKVAHGHM